MNVAFVGVKRKYQELPIDYLDAFNKYHLELPYYYAKYGGNDVTITTVDYTATPLEFDSGGSLRCTTEEVFRNHEMMSKYDVVVHWRKWFEEFYRPEAVNVINCQDHSFSQEWKSNVNTSLSEGKLYGILCFPTWHKRNLAEELFSFPVSRLLDGVTLGVDTEIYFPSTSKSPYNLLWASDPGRGIVGALELAVKLRRLDTRFVLHACVPDYAVKGNMLSNHPAIKWHGNISNGPELWSLFNEAGILPYTSTFKEPSSRAHRQAMAAGAMVLYPIGMGSPSELIEGDVNGIVSDPNTWATTICELVDSGKWQEIGASAREYALAENWEVQAGRFNKLFKGILEEER